MRASNVRRAAFVLSLAACMSTARWDEQESWAGKDVGSFPYHPLVYHLDLSILAYQLHGQTLVWPFDPYYEELAADEDRRDEYMAKVRAWAREQGPRQAETSALEAFRGPGVLGGFPDNDNHDPILYRYGGLHPWSDAVNNMEDRWLEMKTPKGITERIRDAYVCYRRTGGPEEAVVLERIPRGGAGAGARDVLLAFEGGTGDKGDPDQPASQSILGFVLLRTRPDGRYDAHVVFRASRSGSGSRSLEEAHWDRGGIFDRDAAGNPDWITDLGYRKVPFPLVSTTGEVHRGFARSMQSILPKAFRCLEEAGEIRQGERPVSISVTGHSLGGALAQHFVSAVLLGDRYGPGGAGTAMPPTLRDWPWRQIKLVTFSSPRAGDKKFARTLTEHLESDFFTSLISPRDSDALPPADPGIVSRLVDPDRPAGFRVLDSRDPLTTRKVFGGRHAGKTVYVNKPSASDLVPAPSTDPQRAFRVWAHDLVHVRQILLDVLDDPRNPASAMDYREMEELNPERDAEARGSPAEVRKRADALARHYAESGIRFDRAAFEEAVRLRFSIDDGE